jgi:PAN domain-containing protein
MGASRSAPRKEGLHLIRRLPLGLVVVCLATAAQADVYRMTYELNLARSGRPLQSSFIGQGTASTCRDLCSKAPSCMGYTYKKNVTSAPTHNCFLLRSVDSAFADTNSISGQQDPSYYPQACRDLCTQEPRCAAFTYVRAGLQGPRARCYLKTLVPVAKGDTCCVSGVKALATMSALEQDTDRPGADYRRFDVATEDARICRDACAKEHTCAAYTLVRANVHGPSAYCTLKSHAPAPQRNNPKCVSGVKQEWPMSPLETDTDRPGLDLSGQDSGSPEACRAACAREAGCKAFTFVKPGVQGPADAATSRPPFLKPGRGTAAVPLA